MRFVPEHPGSVHCMCLPVSYVGEMTRGYDLERFLAAQERTYDRALAELRSGRKKGHWMWFIFPQLAGLGHSARSAFYGIDGRDEASAYIAHPVLAERLTTCVRVVMDQSRHWRDVAAIFGSPDDLKFHSSITLFSRARPTDPVFSEALWAIYGGVGCQKTLEALRRDFIDGLEE